MEWEYWYKIEISDKAPSDYIDNYLYRFSTKEMRKQYYLHTISLNWENMKYYEFLNGRRKLIAIVVKNGFNMLSNI